MTPAQISYLSHIHAEVNNPDGNQRSGRPDGRAYHKTEIVEVAPDKTAAVLSSLAQWKPKT